MKQVIKNLMILILAFSACNMEDNVVDVTSDPAYKITKNIRYDGVSVKVIIDKPKGSEFDVLIVFHGTIQRTVNSDDLILEAAENTLRVFKGLVDNKHLMIVSVAYPQENILFGDNIIQAEAALLWVKNSAKSEIGIDVKKIFLAGHSQGGYIVTRLNKMHQTNGVVANAPGPLNLVYRCQLEENGLIHSTHVCNLLRNHYGTTTANPKGYFERSLLNFTTGFKADILFVQGLNDSPIQMYSWPIFKDKLINCNTCQSSQFLELAGLGHNALFNSPQAKAKFNDFINSR